MSVSLTCRNTTMWWIRPGFDKMAQGLTPVRPYLISSLCVWGESPIEVKLGVLWSRIIMATSFSRSKLLWLFLWGYCKDREDRVFWKNLHTIHKLKNALQSKILEAFLQELCPSSCTFPNSLPTKFMNFKGHHTDLVSI